MFVYQTNAARAFEPESQVESYFSCPERWKRQGESASLTVVLFALVFGGMAKIVSIVPFSALVATVLTLAYFLGDDVSRGKARRIHQLTLGVTGLFYLGIGYCCGAAALLAFPTWMGIKRYLG